MMRLKFIVCFSVLLGITYLTTAFAETYESIENIKSVTKNFVINTLQPSADDTVDVKISDQSAQLQLPACSKPIDAALPNNASRDSITAVTLTCNDAKSWHVLIPVSVQVQTKVLIAKNTIPAREAISEDDLDYAAYDKNRLYSGYFSNKQDVIGNVASHVIMAGAVLNKKNVQLPMMVYRNQTITLVAEFNTISVSMQGVAKSDGALDSVIKVYNPSSKKTLDAVVIGPNKAKVIAQL